VSELLETVGDEEVVRHFFSRYLNVPFLENTKTGILVDSTGLPNAIRFPLTAINNHNGVVSEEIRLIFVVDSETGIPLFFRYNAGNIVDITTMKATMCELAEFGVSVKNAIIDAGYCSEETIKSLYDSKVKFLTRLPVNRKLYTDAVERYRDEVLSEQCMFMQNDRVVGIKLIYTQLYWHRGYLYLCVDYNKRNDLIRKFTKSAISEKMPRKKWRSHILNFGFFAFVSSEKIEPEELLPLYYTRQTIEQVFDVTKNNANMLPLRVHNEETLRGHIMLTFMATVLSLKLNKYFKGHKVFTAQNALMEMKNLKCKVYDNLLLIKEMTKDMRDVCKMTGIVMPEKIFLPLSQL
jgi:transposase